MLSVVTVCNLSLVNLKALSTLEGVPIIYRSGN